MKLVLSHMISLVLLLLPWQCAADLPVHCVRHQVAGDWEFTLGPLDRSRSSCGHSKPDNPDGQPPMDYLASLGSTETLRVSLQDPDVASTADGLTGMWTMIYDEGFEVAIGDNVYFAFSKFDFVYQGDKTTNVSHCGATQIGWYHNKERTAWGCYFGKKVDNTADVGSLVEPEPPHAPETPRRVSLSAQSSEILTLAPDDDSQQDDAPASTEEQTSNANANNDDNAASDTAANGVSDAASLYTPWVPASNGYDAPMANQWQQSVADALNFMQLGWTAVKYEIFQGKTPRELNKFAGVRHARTPPHAKATIRRDSEQQFSSFLGLGSRTHRMSGADAFDWRKANGQDWLQPVVTQGDCGSCYTIATIHMLTARNRIRNGDKSQPAFSVSFPLYCSEYNQGCDGGYGFLQTKWSEDVGLVPESCARFSQGGGSCHVAQNCELGQKRYRAVNHHYVGGYYGGSAADQIKNELVNDGPLVMSFEPKEDFMYYKNGIYRSAPNKIHQEWEQVDHAVLLVGYGSERGQPFWSMQNSWGDDWGEAGYFRMARGSDESGCESIVVAADVAEEEENNVLDAFISSL